MLYYVIETFCGGGRAAFALRRAVKPSTSGRGPRHNRKANVHAPSHRQNIQEQASTFRAPTPQVMC